VTSTPDVLRRSAAHVVVDDVSAPALDAAAEHHLVRVLRLRDGAVVTVTDGRGAWRECRLAGGALEPVDDIVIAPREREITIGVAVPKHVRPVWIVQKLTELGAARIVFLHAERSVVRWDGERGVRHLDKARRVALEAAHQCRAVWLPEVDGPVAATDFLPGAVAAEPGGRRLTVSDDAIAVGPEGGWTDHELEAALDRVALPGGILRVETAALTACVHALGLDFTT
jgi:16S rRNA (uracil1498-N3)-methyltransferase